MRLKILLLFFCLLFNSVSVYAVISLDSLSNSDITIVKSVVKKLEPIILERQKKQNHAIISFDELYAPLSKKERKFLKNFLQLDTKKLGVKISFQGLAKGKEDLIVLNDQRIKRKGELKYLPSQFVLKNIYDAFQSMMLAMEKDIGKRLYIESGYRSSAYQLYLFMYYLGNHHYSIRETARFVAFPGYSEHGSPSHQAIDFINIDGIGNHAPAEHFETLEEYQWLLKNANRFGFVLSYPRNSPDGMSFEPWHWRYEGLQNTRMKEK